MNKLAEAIHLRKEYVSRKSLFSPKKIVKAVDYASFEILENETLGIVGGRGSGKTVVGGLIAGLSVPDYGRVEFRGRDIGLLRGKEKREIRGKVQIVFQDVAGHMDGRLTIEESIRKSVENCKRMQKGRKPLDMDELLKLSGLSPSIAAAHPSRLDDLNLKKAGIALAALWRPELIVLDDPTGGLDASTRGQVIQTIRKLKEIYGVSCLFLSRDMSVAGKICDRIAIIEGGRIVEKGPAELIMKAPKSEYAREFLGSIL